MALEGVNPNIPLQAGRNLPTFGPDYNALAEMQRTQIAVQNAQLVQNEENALRAAYGNSANLQPGTNQLTPQAINQLMAVSPRAGAKAVDMNAMLAQNQTVTAARNADIYKKWVTDAQQMADEVAVQYDADLKATNDQKQAQDNAQKRYAEGLDALTAAGLPPNLRQSMSPTFDIMRIRARQQAQNAQKLSEKTAEGWEVREDFGRLTSDNKPTQYSYNKITGQTMDIGRNAPYTPSGVGKPERGTEPEPFVGTVDGKQINLRRDPDGGYMEDKPGGKHVEATNVHKVGSKDPAEAKYGKVSEVVIDDPENPGKTKTVLAQQDPKSGQWVTADANREPLPSPKSILSTGTAGGRESIYIQRALTSGQEAVSQLKTIAQLPSGASSGWFGLGRTQGVSPWAATKEVLVNKVSSQEVQEYKSLAAGLQRELASLAASGVGINQHYIDAFNSDMLAEGDTQETKLLKLARQRQTAENALEAVLANPRLGQDQRKLAESQIKGLQDAIPWTPIDVVRLIHSEKPGETLSDLAGKKGLGKSQEGQTVPLAPRGQPGTDTIEPTTAGAGAPAVSVKPDNTGVYDLTDPSQLGPLPSGARYRRPGDPPGTWRTK